MALSARFLLYRSVSVGARYLKYRSVSVGGGFLVINIYQSCGGSGHYSSTGQKGERLL